MTHKAKIESLSLGVLNATDSDREINCYQPISQGRISSGYVVEQAFCLGFAIVAPEPLLNKRRIGHRQQLVNEGRE